MSGAPNDARRQPTKIHIAEASASRCVTLQSRSSVRTGSRVVPFFRDQVHDQFGHVVPNMSLPMELNLTTLDNAYLLVERGRDGVIIDADGNLIWETCFFTDSEFSRFTLDYLRDNAVEIDQPLFVALDGSWRNYYHWTVIGLGRSMIYNHHAKRDNASVIFDYLGRDSKTWRIGFSHDLWRDSLEATGVGRNSLVLKDGIYRIKSLDYLWHTVNQPPYLSFFSSFYTGFDGIAAGASDPSIRRKNIVVARALDARLTPIASEALSLLVDRAGFEIVDFELLDFGEQVRLLGQTNAIVAPHGAGLTNLLYAPGTTKVIELNKRLNGEQHLRPWFYLLAAGKKQQYSYLDLDRYADDPMRIHDRIVELAHL